MNVRRYLRYWPVALALLISGAVLWSNIDLAVKKSRRQTENNAKIATLEARGKAVGELLDKEDPDSKNVVAARKHLIYLEHHLFVARMDNDNNGYCFLYSSEAELDLALEKIGRRWEWDDQNRLSKEHFLGDDRKVYSTTTYFYGANSDLEKTVSTFAEEGQVFAEEFFAGGKKSIVRHFMGGCRVGNEKAPWRAETMILTFYKPDGKRYREQMWSLKEGTTQHDLLGHVVDFDDDGKRTREWSFGGVFVAREEDDPKLAGKVPTQLETWGNGLVIEELRGDGSVRKRTTYAPHKDGDDLNRKPSVEKFNGTEGGVRKLDPALMAYPRELLRE